jgi:tetratricopeptide (TPR) repeat protein
LARGAWRGGVLLAFLVAAATATLPGPTLAAAVPAACRTTPLPPPSAFRGAANLRRWTSLARSHPRSAQAQVNAGIAAYQNGLAQQAIAWYRRALSIDPKDGAAAADIGNVYRNLLHDPARARAAYEQAVRIDPGYAYGWYDLLVLEVEEIGHLRGDSREAALATARLALRRLPACASLVPYIRDIERQLAR